MSNHSDKFNGAHVYFNKKRRLSLRLLDRFLTFIYAFRCLRAVNGSLSECKKVLILESHLIGDVIMGLPAYRAIRERFRDCELIFWGNQWGQELLQDQGLFDSFFITRIPWSTYDYSFSNLRRLCSQVRQVRKLGIDLALDFRGDIRNIFLLRLTRARRRISYDFTGGSYWLTDIVPRPESGHIVDRNLKVAAFIGAASNQSIPTLSVPHTKVRIAREYFDKTGLQRIVFLQAGASQPKRLWASERFGQVADYLQEKGYSPVLLCGPSDTSVVEAIKKECRPSSCHVLSVALKDLPAFLMCGTAVIGLDSGIAHIAAALGKNVIMLFGPQLPSITSARGGGMIQVIMKSGFECRPCHEAVCGRDNACMRAIQVADVTEAIEKLEKDEQAKLFLRA